MRFVRYREFMTNVSFSFLQILRTKKLVAEEVLPRHQ